MKIGSGVKKYIQISNFMKFRLVGSPIGAVKSQRVKRAMGELCLVTFKTFRSLMSAIVDVPHR